MSLALPSFSFPGIDKAPTRRARYRVSVRKVVLHVKQCCIPEKGVSLPEKDKVQHRARIAIWPGSTSATRRCVWHNH
ncbi:MAG: hypothetical protein EGQ74_21570 [Bacteroides nordii]|nr:hypothetical protein [Bacteroides nordii]